MHEVPLSESPVEAIADSPKEISERPLQKEVEREEEVLGLSDEEEGFIILEEYLEEDEEQSYETTEGEGDGWEIVEDDEQMGEIEVLEDDEDEDFWDDVEDFEDEDLLEDDELDDLDDEDEFEDMDDEL